MIRISIKIIYLILWVICLITWSFLAGKFFLMDFWPEICPYRGVDKSQICGIIDLTFDHTGTFSILATPVLGMFFLLRVAVILVKKNTLNWSGWMCEIIIPLITFALFLYCFSHFPPY